MRPQTHRVVCLWQYYGNIHCSEVHSSGENVLHHHSTEITALPEQTSKYSNEHLVRTPNQQYVHFFLSRYPSLLEDKLGGRHHEYWIPKSSYFM